MERVTPDTGDYTLHPAALEEEGTMKKMFKIDITYFRSGGKMYASGPIGLMLTAIGDNNDFPYMTEAFDHVCALRDAGKPMPGLRGSWNEGPILVDCEDGYPRLIMPDER